MCSVRIEAWLELGSYDSEVSYRLPKAEVRKRLFAVLYIYNSSDFIVISTRICFMVSVLRISRRVIGKREMVHGMTDYGNWMDVWFLC